MGRNQRPHHDELKKATKDRDFAAIDEVTDAFPLLLAALPAESGDKETAAKPLAEAGVKDLAAIHAAGPPRMPDAAKANVTAVETTVAALKKLFLPAIANAKLAE